MGMLTRVGHKNILIVGPLKSQLNMFHLSVQHMIPKDRIFSNISSKFFLSKIMMLFFIVVFLTKSCFVWEK